MREHLAPDFGVALPHAGPVHYQSLGVKGYLGGLNGDLEVGQQVSLGHGHRPGIPLFYPKPLVQVDIFNREDANCIEVYFAGIFRVNLQDSLQLSDADASSCGEEEQEGGPAFFNQLGRSHG